MSKYVPTQSQAFAKSLLRLGVHKIGGAAVAAEWIGVQESEISRMGSDDVDRHIHLSRFIELDEACGHALLKALARRYGFEVVVNEAASAHRQNVVKAAGDGIEASARYFRKALDFGSDGDFSNNEQRELEGDKHKLIAEIEGVDTALHSLRVVKG